MRPAATNSFPTPAVRISATLLSFLLAWLGFLISRAWGGIFDELALAVLAWMISPLMVAALGRKWGYRAAFIITLGAGLAGEMVSLPPVSRFTGWGWPALAFFFVFAGGLLATARDTGLWEDNFPPSAEIMDEVLNLHQKHLVSLPKIPAGKRIFDVIAAFTGAVLSAPVWIVIAFCIWFEDPGPLLFVKNSVGRGGRNFHQFKFRSMVRDAEKDTGPVLASEDDVRVLKIGYILRKTALDELPQLLNILRGEMSFVGPRPQRTVLVRDYLLAMPEYAGRHAVSPGISGLAQVVGSYYITPRQKLRLDRLYVRHASLGFDLKLLVIAFLLVFYLRWKKGWKGKVPREWLRYGSKNP